MEHPGGYRHHEQLERDIVHHDVEVDVVDSSGIGENVLPGDVRP